jgi:hypothetical protein
MPSSEGLRAHVELAKISGIIVCETFRIAPRQPPTDSSASSIDTALAMLQSWQAQLPPNLQMPGNLSHIDPSCCILHMAHNQLVLLTTRPIFFSAVKQTVAQRVVQSRSPTEQHPQRLHVHLCATTAHRNLLLAQRITESSRRLLQAGLHFVFNAAVILLLNRIMSMQGLDIGHSRPTATTHEQLESGIHFALQTFQNEARTGTNYPKDCYRVLQDLKALTDRYIASRYSAMDQKHDKIHSTGDDFSSLGLPTAQPQLGATDGVYEEMMTWVHSDGLQFHDGLFI